MRSSSSIYFAGALLVLLSVRAAEATNAHYGLTISTAATRNVQFSGGVFTATGENAVLNINDLENAFSTSSVTVTTGNGPDGTHKGDLHVEAPVSWTSSTLLTLDAYRSIVIDRPVSDAGAGALTISTNHGGAGGELSFHHKGRIIFTSTASTLTINGQIYKLVDTIAALGSAIADNPSGFYALSDNYNASKDGVYTDTPIPTAVTGSIDGLGNTIDNLLIHCGTNGAGLGLFATIQPGATLQHIGMKSAHIVFRGAVSAGILAGNNFGVLFGDTVSGVIETNDFSYQNPKVGGLVGYNGGTISNSGSKGHIAIPQVGAVTGGLVGQNSGPIKQSLAATAIEGRRSLYPSMAGGLVGDNYGAISESFSTGAVGPDASGSGAEIIGGLVGRAESGGSISNSYSTGAVTGAHYEGGGTFWAGGFAGINNTAITTSYSLGKVSYVSDFVPFMGGFLGSGDIAAKAHCYWNTETSGQSQGSGSGHTPGLTGLTTEQFKSVLPKGFDPAVWAQKAGINNGYPYLIANPPPQ